MTGKTLKDAINLAEKVFPNEEEPPSPELLASLYPKKYREFLKKAQISDLKYWVAIDNLGKVVGIAGLYCNQKDKNEAFWLGWFCVDPETRKKSVGSKLLRFSIEKARKRGKKFLRLYTSTDPNELNSHRLYKKYGFKLIDRESYPNSNLEKLYYELKL